MKKALSSVFKGKSNNTIPSKNKLDDNTESNLEKEKLKSSASRSVNDLNQDHVVNRPPPAFVRMKSCSSTALSSNLEKSEKLLHQISSNSSASNKSSHVMHHYSSQDLKQHKELSEEETCSQTGADRKLSYKSSTTRSFDRSLDMQVASTEQILGIDGDDSTNEPIVTSPSGSPPPLVKSFEQRRATSASKSKMLSEGFSAEKSSEKSQELRRMQSKDTAFEESSSVSAMKARMESNGFSASKLASSRQDQKQVKIGESLLQQHSSSKASAIKMTSEEVSADKKSFAAKQEARMTSSSSSRFVSKSATMSMTSSSSNIHQMSEYGPLMGSPSGSPIITEPFSPNALAMSQEVDVEFELLGLSSSVSDMVGKSGGERTAANFTKVEKKMSQFVDKLREASRDEAIDILRVLKDMFRKAWSVPNQGNDLRLNLCNILKNSGGLDILMKNCKGGADPEIQYLSAQLIEHSLSTENRTYIVENGLSDVVRVACTYATKSTGMSSAMTSKARVGTGIFEHFFKHSEETCKDLIKMGALNAVLDECRTSMDTETLRHCAAALANLCLYGGPEEQLVMIKQKVPDWLFVLASNFNDNVKYHACLAIAALVANKEIEAAVLVSGTLNLVEPFVTSHSPQELANSPLFRILGQSKNWLMRMVPVLDSDREEARSLAAFHFAMEAVIKKQQGDTSVFYETGAVEALKKVAASPNAIASKFAGQALKLVGEAVPHKLSQQVPLWTVEDVKEWVKQIGFFTYASEFVNSRVDGDILLQLTEDMLRQDIGISNGILRRRFLRELGHLKRITDYSSCDSSDLFHILNSLGPVYAQYTYSMVQCGVDQETLRLLTDDQLLQECKVENSIHRLKIVDAIGNINQSTKALEEDPKSKKSLDVFVSYRRSNGSQLASLLKVLLQQKGFSTFIDVERLEAGKFDCNLINSIKQAKHFILVLTPDSLERCVGDIDCKDWIHREIVEALSNECNIIPILENFEWPKAETLPEDMRGVCDFNGIRWIHEYQDACIEKLERFIRGTLASTELDTHSNPVQGLPPTPGTPTSSSGNKSGPAYQRTGSNEAIKSNHVTHG